MSALASTDTKTHANATTASTALLRNSTPDYTHGLTGVNLQLDQTVVKYLWISIVAALSAVLILRLWQLSSAHIRHIYCLHANADQQRYWTFDKTWWWPWLKKEVIYAPLGSKRHNREIQLSSAVNYGTLPGRIHTIMLALYVITNIIYCMILPYGKVSRAQIVAELRGRSGMLAVVNMIPMIVLAGRNNPGIALLKISFDTFNLFHRWVGRLVILESVVHVSAWFANMMAEKGSAGAAQSIRSGAFIQYGMVAMVAMMVILVQTLSAIRHAFYETFLHLHQLLAIIAIIGVYVHLEAANLPALPFIRAVVALWLAERIARVLRLLWANVNFRNGQLTYVNVQALPAEACRVTFTLPKHITVRPGSHVFVYLPTISSWQSHPFSVAWIDEQSEPPTGLTAYEGSCKDSESQSHLPAPANRKRPTEVSLIVAARSGMTRKLYNKAKAGQLGRINMPGFIEGPYAGHDSLSSYGTVVMFAGGAGITHHLVQIRHLIACAQAGTVATRRIVLVWTIRDQEALHWIQEWMDEILQMPGRKGMLRMIFYVTRPRRKQDFDVPSSSIEVRPKRCDPSEVLDEVLPGRVGATMVTVCGPGAFADEVRAAVRQRIEVGNIDMNEESFTW